MTRSDRGKKRGNYVVNQRNYAFRCGHCFRPFFANKSTASYCSPSCRTKAAYRRKKSAAGKSNSKPAA